MIIYCKFSPTPPQAGFLNYMNVERLNIKNFDTRIDRRDLRLIDSTFGHESRNFFYSNYRGRNIPNDPDLPKRIDQEFFRNLSQRFGVEFKQEDYLDALKKAAETHNYIITTLGLPEWELGLLNEVLAFSESPFDRLKLLSSRDINPLLRFQLAEQLLLALIGAESNMRTKNQRLRTQLDNFVKMTDKELFSSKLIGDTRVIDVYSTHDYQNKVVDIGFSSFTHLANNVREKKTPLRVREIKKDKNRKFVITFDIRKKDDRIVTLKAIEKAMLENGDVQLESVTDMIGKKFIIIDGDKKDLIAIFDSIMRCGFRVKKVDKDDSTEKTRGQSPRHRFSRRQYHINGNKFEVIFYNLREFLNSEYDIGDIDENGFYNGAAHSLYELKRIACVASLLFPKELYGFNIDEYIKLAYQREANRLLDFNNSLQRL